MKKWTKKSRRMMQVCIDDYKVILRKHRLKTFIAACGVRKCPFCDEVYGNCGQCRITKYFGEQCYSVFPIWDNFFRLYNRELGESKARLNLAIKELEPWGTEVEDDK